MSEKHCSKHQTGLIFNYSKLPMAIKSNELDFPRIQAQLVQWHPGTKRLQYQRHFLQEEDGLLKIQVMGFVLGCYPHIDELHLWMKKELDLHLCSRGYNAQDTYSGVYKSCITMISLCFSISSAGASILPCS